MSLKNLLAVGESFFGTESAPYQVKATDPLPVFGKDGQRLAQAAQAPEEKPQVEMDFEKQAQARLRISPERRAIPPEPQERRRFLDRAWRAPSRRMTQSEMSLENVRVVRNDLSDSDLELTPRRAARSADSGLSPFAPRPIAAIGRPSHEKQSFGTRMARWFRFLKRGKP